MRRVFGPRTAIEAVLLVAVPIAALLAGQGPAVIIASAGIAYLLVILFEMGVWRSRPQPDHAGAPAPAEVAVDGPVEVPDTVRVLPTPEEPAAEPVAAEPQPEPEPEPEPAPPIVLTPVPDLPPEPPAVAVAMPEPEPQVVVTMPIGNAPRQWNLWDLERLSRQHAGSDAIRDEERSFLLMYLRDFAGPDGLLPIDFDGLVRDSFGDLVGVR